MLRELVFTVEGSFLGHPQGGTWGWQACPPGLTQRCSLPCGESQQVSSVEEPAMVPLRLI